MHQSMSRACTAFELQQTTRASTSVHCMVMLSCVGTFQFRSAAAFMMHRSVAIELVVSCSSPVCIKRGICQELDFCVCSDGIVTEINEAHLQKYKHWHITSICSTVCAIKVIRRRQWRPLLAEHGSALFHDNEPGLFFSANVNCCVF